ncbi:hypothetical protein VYU27_001986 [Nannochloropsis oceanica]
MRPTAMPLLLLCLAISASIMTATWVCPPAFVAAFPGHTRNRQDQQLLFCPRSRGVLLLSSFPQKEDVSEIEIEEEKKVGPVNRPTTLTMTNTTTAAFDLLVTTIENWATLIEDRQDLSKEEIIDRLDEWMHKIDGDQRLARVWFEKLNKDIHRILIIVLIFFGISLAAIAPTWFAAK